MMPPSRQLSSLVLTGALILGSVWLLSSAWDFRHDYSELDGTRLGYPPPRNHSLPGGVLSELPPRRRKNVAVASGFGPHFDVYMAFAKTLGDVMDEDGDGGYTIHVFAQDFAFGFQDLVDELHLWKHRGVRGKPEELFDHLSSNTEAGSIDLVVLGTCEVEWVSRTYPDSTLLVC